MNELQKMGGVAALIQAAAYVVGHCQRHAPDQRRGRSRAWVRIFMLRGGPSVSRKLQ